MRARFSSRLAKLEESVISRPDKAKLERRLESQRHARKELEGNPDLALVTEKDATPLAWRHIRLTRANAEGDFETGERLFQEQFQRPKAPPDAPDPFVWQMNQLGARLQQQSEDVRDAIANAKKRLERDARLRQRPAR